MERIKTWVDEFIINKLISLLDILTKKPGYFLLLTILALFQYKAYFLDRVTKHQATNMMLFWIFLICTTILVIHMINTYFVKKEESPKYKNIKGIALFVLLFFNLMMYVTSFVMIAKKYVVPFLNHYTGDERTSVFVLALLIITAGYLISYFRMLFKTKQEVSKTKSQ